jgi:hypothetical protein
VVVVVVVVVVASYASILLLSACLSTSIKQNNKLFPETFKSPQAPCEAVRAMRRKSA